MQYTAIFYGFKKDNFLMKNCGIFLISAQKIDCGCTLEPPHCGGSNEYPQSMFEIQNIDCWYTLEQPLEAVLMSAHNLSFEQK